MARVILKANYYKPNGKKKVGGYAKYIATREGVDKVDESFKLAPSSVKQQKLIEKILREFPDTKDSHEYEDYMREPTLGNASEFIGRAIEENAVQMEGSKTYADYIATRPRAEKFGTHGLFTDDGVEVKLDEVSRQLNEHDGNVWTLILSLRREDAERLGFDTGTRWRDMLRGHTESLARNLKIPMENLKWYAAFHNEGHHPHVHIIAYSENASEGYLTPQGIDNLRSEFARDIFSQDLISVYQKQTEHRDELRKVSRERIEEIVRLINEGGYDNPVVEKKLALLAERLSRTKGKKQYGYLKADVKAIVCSIVDELAKDERIAELYDLWYEQKEETIKTYQSTMPDRVPLSQNEEFKSIRNAVINEAMNIVLGKEPVEDQTDTDIPVFRGSDAFLKDKNTPIPSPAAENIIQTVMGSDEPVLIFSIGAITNVASALLMCPELAERTAVVWLGGHALENPNTREFNMVQDVAAAQIVFDSGIPLLQIPCAGVCTQCHTTVYELEHYIDGKNELCTYLTDNVRKALTGWYGHLVKHANGTPVNHAVSGVIWDALAAATLIRPCACEIVKLPRPIITSDCLYAFDSARRPYLYTRGLNRDMIYGDIFDRLTRE